MKRFRVHLLDKAEAHLEEINLWWRRHRREHPDLVVEEMREAIRALASFPEIGEVFRPRRSVRRMLLRQSQYYVYYVVDHDAHEVQVLAIWHNARGKGPPLR
jgi:plasmid stabilization system protein ParE